MTAAVETGSSRVALVTGAARGIGLACALRLRDAGHAVVLVDRDTTALVDAARHWPAGRALAIDVDLGESDCAERVAQRMRSRGWEPGDRVDILINNAGISPKHGGRAPDILEMDLDEWQRVLDVNLTAAMLMARQFLPGMRQRHWGRIVNVCSMAGRTAALLSGPAYMASKAGMLGLTRHIASRFAKDGITANAVAPGRIRTAMADTSGAEATAQYNARNPSGREGTVDEVAAAVAFLASMEAGYCNGAVIDINGGSYMA